jgi:hypothetical protein
MTDLNPYYLVDSEGRCFYPIQASADHPPLTPSGEPVRVMNSDGGPGHSYVRNLWVMTPEPIAYLDYPQPPFRQTVQYRLKDETAASTRFPLTLSPAEYQAIVDQEDPDGDGIGLAYAMYRAVQEEKPQEPKRVDLSAMAPMTGTADEHGSWGWEPERTAGMLYGPMYHHLLPGILHGVRDRMAAKLADVYGKSDFFGARRGFSVDSRTGEFSIDLQLEYDKPVIVTKPRYGVGGRRLKGTQHVKESFRLQVQWNQATKITANTKAEAVAEYHRAEAAMLEWVASHHLEVCHNCKGEGWTKAYGPKP